MPTAGDKPATPKCVVGGCGAEAEAFFCTDGHEQEYEAIKGLRAQLRARDAEIARLREAAVLALKPIAALHHGERLSTGQQMRDAIDAAHAALMDALREPAPAPAAVRRVGLLEALAAAVRRVVHEAAPNADDARLRPSRAAIDSLGQALARLDAEGGR